MSEETRVVRLSFPADLLMDMEAVEIEKQTGRKLIIDKTPNKMRYLYHKKANGLNVRKVGSHKQQQKDKPGATRQFKHQTHKTNLVNRTKFQLDSVPILPIEPSAS